MSENNINTSYVSLKDINKIYPNGVQAVYNFNIDINKHDFIVLVGPSGCGKSTTLRMIAGLEDITSGELFIDGEYSNNTPSSYRDISMVFQNYALYPQKNVFANIAFPLKNRKVNSVKIAYKIQAVDQILKLINNYDELVNTIIESKDSNRKYSSDLEYISTKLKINYFAAKLIIKHKKEIINNSFDKFIDFINQLKNNEIKMIEESGYQIDDNYNILDDGKKIFYQRKLSKVEIKDKVFRIAELLDLGAYLDRKPSELSGGQCQRVALGRAIVRDSKLFLMDEPLSNLDAKLRVQMRSEIVRIHERIGATTIYVTHDQTEAMTMATKIAIMSKGWIQQIGTPSEVYNNPTNIFVATFIGTPQMNIFNAKYKDGVVTFANGYSLEVSKEFKTRHDEYYKNKINELTKMIEESDFIKMKGLFYLDNIIFKENATFSSSGFSKDLLLFLKEIEKYKIYDEVNSLMNKYIDNNDFVNTITIVNKIYYKRILLDLLEIIKDINDVNKDKINEIINFELSLLSDIDINSNIDIFDSYVESYNYVKNIINEVDLNKTTLSIFDKLNLKDRILDSQYSTLLKIRGHLLTVDDVSSNYLKILHNAQVFNKDVVEEENILFYQKPKKKKKEVNYHLNINDSKIEFTNNLYDVAISLLNKCQNALNNEHSIRVGIRPENIYVYDNCNSNLSSPFDVSADVVELLGSELLIHSTFSNSKIIAKVDVDKIINTHSNVTLAFDKNKIIFFDDYSGDTI